MHANRSIALALGGMVALHTGVAQAQSIPGSADPGRIDKRQSPEIAPQGEEAPKTLPEVVQPTTAVPEQSKKIYFTLHRVTIDGMHAFAPDEVSEVYREYIDREVTLDMAWLIAERITKRYHDKGYFLSRAYVPQQKIDAKKGELRLGVVEGYVAEVTLDDTLKNSKLIKEWTEQLTNTRPIASDFLESVLLQINDIPGVELRATLEPITTEDYPEGAVRMVLTKQAVSNRAQVSMNNTGSKYLGPNSISFQYDAVLIPRQATSLNVMATMPMRELKYGTLRHRIPVFPGVYGEIYGGYTFAKPGYTLAPSEIKSNSLTTGMSLSYQLIRQRQENLAAKIAFETRDTYSDILMLAPLTRDRIRVLRTKINYETADAWRGYNQLAFTFSQGLGIFDASGRGVRNLSRAEAISNFQKGEITFSRTQYLSPSWAMVTNAAGQVASGPLYSSEEFGYGGQSYGRAYDSSEIVGDHGYAASVEMRYYGIDRWQNMAFMPYGFYDGGAVFNDDRTQLKTQTATSAGLGVRIDTGLGITADIAAAVPMSRAAETPIYGNGKDPRYTIELSYGF